MVGEFHVNTQPPRPIRQQGAPVAAFLPGWAARCVYQGLAPVYLLLLEHADGAWAIWFLDEELDRKGGSYGELPAAMRNQLMTGFSTLFDGIWSALVTAPVPHGLTEAQLVFLGLPLDIRHQMLRMYLANFDFATRYQLLSDPAGLPGSAKIVDLGERRVLLDPEHLDYVYRANALQDAYPALLRTGVLAMPSLVDGQALHVTHSFVLGGNRFAYRLVDRANGFTTYLIADEIYFRVACIFVPQARLALSHDPAHTKSLMPDLCRTMFHHAVEHGVALEKYLRAPAQEVVHAWRGMTAMHLGHMLWNDISGIAQLVASVPARQLPRCLIFDTIFEPEMYGPLDELFPELHGKMIRSPGSFESAVASFYRDRLLLIKATEMKVTRSVRERIIGRLLDRPAHSALVAECRQAAADGPVITLGLRTENRTLTDLRGFCERLIGFLAGAAGRATLVVDGHNSRGGGSDKFLSSHGEAHSPHSPIAIEQAIVAALRRGADGTGIRIVSTIGAPLASSLIWCWHSHFFVTPWGAGLAKYRWVCNKPGLVVTSRWNLQNRNDLHIYDTPSCIEEPAPIVFIDQDAVTDRADAPLLVDLGPSYGPSIMNFDLDEQVVFGIVAGLLGRYATPRRRRHERRRTAGQFPLFGLSAAPSGGSLGLRNGG